MTRERFRNNEAISRTRTACRRSRPAISTSSHKAMKLPRRDMARPKSNWIAAAELGLVSSTFSTIVSQLTAAPLGRDAFVDWMTVAAIPFRDQVLSAEPTGGAVLAGILFHQWADFSWALVFFGLFGRWTAALPPCRIFLLAVPWAAFSSG